MQSVRSIGLLSAILININVIIGSGLFINLHPLISKTGTASFVVYLVAALFLLPVVASLAFLAREQPESGGLYVYTKTYVHPFLGFLCGWAYFVGKAVSVGLMAHLLVTVCEQAFPVLQGASHIVLVASLLLFLAVANIAGAAIQGRVQRVAIAAKLIPVLAIFGLLLYSGPQVPFSCELVSADALEGLVPVAVFAMVGFEVTCTIAHLFVRPSYTIPRAFIFGFLIVVAIVALFQAAVAGLVPFSLLQTGSPAAAVVGAFNTYAPSLTGASALLTACIYLSILGGTFGILTSNCWNLHRLAVAGYMPGARWLTKVTAGQVPWVSLLVQVAICVLGVAISSEQVPLQKMSVLGVVFAFFCAMLAALLARTGEGRRLVHPAISVTALCTTGLLFCFTLYQIFLYGVSLPYLLLCGFGILCGVLYGK